MLAAAVAVAALVLSPAEAFQVSLANVKMLQTKAAVIKTSVETTTLPTSCPVKPSKTSLDCYASVGLVATVPGTTACMCSNGNVYTTDPAAGPCTVANCATIGLSPSPGAMTATPMSLSAANQALFGPMATQQNEDFGENAICVTAVIPADGSAAIFPINIGPGVGLQMQSGLNATMVATEDTTVADDTNVASYVTDGCDASLKQMAGSVTWSDFCNTPDCNKVRENWGANCILLLVARRVRLTHTPLPVQKAYQAPHTPSTISSGGMHSLTGSIVAGRKMLF
jgi:hypothetical protein